MEVAPKGGMEGLAALSVALLNQSGMDCAASGLSGAVWAGDKGVGVAEAPCWLSMFFNQSASSGWAKEVGSEAAGTSPKLLNQPRSSCDEVGLAGTGSSKDGADVPPKLFNQLKSSCGAG